MNSKLKSILKYTIFVAIAVVLLYFAFRGNDPQKMLEDLKQADYKWAVLGMLSGYVAFIARGFRWKILLEPMGYNTSGWNGTHAVNVGYLANLAFPRLGEVSRCTALNRVEKVPIDKLIGTVLLERVVDLFMLGLAFGLTLILKFDTLKTFILSGLAQKKSNGEVNVPTWLYFAAIAIVVLCVLVWVLRKKLLEIALVQKLLGIAKGIFDGFKTILHIKQKGLFWGYTIAIWLMYFLMSYLYFFCLPATEHLTLSDGLFLMIAGSLGMIAPAPGGIGAFHAAVIAGLITLGIQTEVAGTYAIIVHSSQTLMILASGLLALFLLSLAGKRKY